MKTGRWSLWLAVLCLAAAPARAQNVAPLSDADILRMAGDTYASGELPLGDGHYVLDAPRKGFVYLCRSFGGGGGAQRDGPWIHGQTWNLREKLAVQGQVIWDEARFSAAREGNERLLTGNGLPVGFPTGIFPIRPGDPAYTYDRNPNAIQQQSVREALPADPAYTDPPYCMGMEVGYMLNGVPLFNAFDAGLRDAAAHEVQDSCQGHPQRNGLYHYHSLSACIQNAGVKAVIGYALDGFPITGPMAAPGKYLTTADLDECHGITSEIVEDGRSRVTYHYVMTVDFPYSASCFRGKPARTGPPRQSRSQGSEQENGASGPGPMMMQSGFSPTSGGRSPPAEALAACGGKSDGDGCGFTSPRGDGIAGACHTPPGQQVLACIPAGR